MDFRFVAIRETMNGPCWMSEFRFEIAISFAGDNKRDVVRRIAELLRHEVGDGKVFFDEWFEAELAGPDAHVVLQNYYGKMTRLVVTCVCERYNEKPWTQEEWRAIQAFERDMRDAGQDNVKRMRFLPLRFGDGGLDGLFSTAIVPDVRDRTPEDVVGLILDRLDLAKRVKGDSDSPRNELLRSPAFHYGEIVDAAHFIGRETELRTAMQYLNERRSFLLSGRARMGKTSFCCKLAEESFESSTAGTAVAYLSAQSFLDNRMETFLRHTLLALFGDFARGIFRAQYRDLNAASQRGTGIRYEHEFSGLQKLHELAIPFLYETEGVAPAAIASDQFAEFIAAMSDLIRAVGYERIAIVYDEANCLCRYSGHSGENLSASLDERLKVLQDAGATVVCIATPELEESFASLKPLFSTWLELGPFESINTMVKLISQYYFEDASGHADLPIDWNALERIWNATEGRPFQIQLLAGHSFLHAKSSSACQVDVTHVENALGILASERPQDFSV